MVQPARSSAGKGQLSSEVVRQTAEMGTSRCNVDVAGGGISGRTFLAASRTTGGATTTLSGQSATCGSGGSGRSPGALTDAASGDHEYGYQRSHQFFQ